MRLVSGTYSPSLRDWSGKKIFSTNVTSRAELFRLLAGMYTASFLKTEGIMHSTFRRLWISIRRLFSSSMKSTLDAEH